MSKSHYRVRNWKDYNKALKERGSLTFWFSMEGVVEWTPPASTGKRGRSCYYSDVAITCALTLKNVYRLPLRATEGMLRSLLDLLKLELSSPDYTTLCRRGKHLKIKLQAPSKEARHVLVDSTGVRVMGEREWKKRLQGEGYKQQVWKKLHIAMDADQQMILSAIMSDSVRLDCHYLPKLVAEIPESIDQITGDGGYDKRCCYQVAYERKARPVFPPQHDAAIQKNKIKKDPALVARDEVIRYLGRGEERPTQLKEWKKQRNYHRRSLVETMMGRMKSLFSDEIRSRCEANQRVDLLIRCAAMNKITQQGMPHSMRVE